MFVFFWKVTIMFHFILKLKGLKHSIYIRNFLFVLQQYLFFYFFIKTWAPLQFCFVFVSFIICLSITLFKLTDNTLLLKGLIRFNLFLLVPHLNSCSILVPALNTVNKLHQILLTYSLVTYV